MQGTITQIWGNLVPDRDFILQSRSRKILIVNACQHRHTLLTFSVWHFHSSLNSLVVIVCDYWMLLSQISTRTETFTDLSVAAVSNDNIRYINTRVSCDSLVVHSDQPNMHVFVSCGWLWWFIKKIFRQVVDMIYVIVGSSTSLQLWEFVYKS